MQHRRSHLWHLRKAVRKGLDIEMRRMTRVTRHPQRTCLGCGERDDQDKLIRLAVIDHDQVRVEPQRGRGGYLHPNQPCQKAFVSRKGHFRAFRVELSRAAKAKVIEDLAGRNRE